MVVYLETNWIVACVLPHHPLHVLANSLWTDGSNGKCELRIPRVAFIESRHVIARETQAHANAMADTARALNDAGRNMARGDLTELAKNVSLAEESYRLKNPTAALQEFLKKIAQTQFSDIEKEHEALDQLRDQVQFKGQDITDLHVIAAILANRQNATNPAAFLSDNYREFDVTRASTKLPRDIYANRKLVYHQQFSLDQASKKWARAEADGWKAPAEPQKDERRKEAQSIVASLPEPKLDEAVTRLKDLAAT